MNLINKEENRLKLLQLIHSVERNRKDLTSFEPHWFQLGCVCYSVLGAVEGRLAFHRLSQFYPYYSHTLTDRKFDHIVKHDYNYYGIERFIEIWWANMEPIKK